MPILLCPFLSPQSGIVEAVERARVRARVETAPLFKKAVMVHTQIITSHHNLLHLCTPYIKMSLIPFTAVGDFSTVLSLGNRAQGLNSTVFIDARPGHANLFQGPSDMKQSYYIKPQGLADKVKEGDKFEINLQIDEEKMAEFKAAAGTFDEWVLSTVHARKGELLPTKASFINSVDALRPLYVSGRLIKTGAASDKLPSGKYNDTMRLRVVGDWAKYVKGVNTRVVNVRGTAKTTVDSCEWTARTTPVAPNETRFYLWVRTNEAGKDVYTDKITGPDGVTRLVGPQDAQPGCTVTPLFSISHMYFTDGFGVTATARALYIKPRLEEAGAGGEEGDGAEGGASKKRKRDAELPTLGGAVIESSEETTVA